MKTLANIILGLMAIILTTHIVFIPLDHKVMYYNWIITIIGFYLCVVFAQRVIK